MHSRTRRRRSRDRITYFHNDHPRKKSHLLCTITVVLLALISGLIIGITFINTYKLLYRQRQHGRKIGLYGRPPLNPKINNKAQQNGHGILSVVLPTHCDRFDSATLTLESLSAYTQSKTFDELLIVTPQRCPFKPLPTKQLSNIFTSGIKSISDESLIQYIKDTNIYKQHWIESTESDSHSNTWHKQMLLKLAIAYVVKSPFFLILDDDILQINPTSLQDFISIQLSDNNNIDHFNQKQNISSYFNVASPINFHRRKLHTLEDDEELGLSMKANWVYDYSNWKVEWYQNSAKLLHAEHCMNDDDLTFGVTPAILHSGAVRSAIERMNDLNGMNGVDGYWSEYAIYRVEFCLRQDFLKYHSKDPTLDFDKKLYTRYSNSLTESAESIYNVDEAIEIMELHQKNDNIFIILQDGAVPDRIREQSWNKWIQNHFDDQQQSLFMQSRNSNINNNNEETIVTDDDVMDGQSLNDEIELNGFSQQWNDSFWLRVIVIINIMMIIGYLIFLSPMIPSLCGNKTLSEKDTALIS